MLSFIEVGASIVLCSCPPVLHDPSWCVVLYALHVLLYVTSFLWCLNGSHAVASSCASHFIARYWPVLLSINRPMSRIEALFQKPNWRSLLKCLLFLFLFLFFFLWPFGFLRVARSHSPSRVKLRLRCVTAVDPGLNEWFGPYVCYWKTIEPPISNQLYARGLAARGHTYKGFRWRRCRSHSLPLPWRISMARQLYISNGWQDLNGRDVDAWTSPFTTSKNGNGSSLIEGFENDRGTFPNSTRPCMSVMVVHGKHVAAGCGRDGGWGWRI